MTDLELLVRLIWSVVDDYDRSREQVTNARRRATWKSNARTTARE